MNNSEQIMSRAKQSFTDQFIRLVEKEVNCDDELLSHQQNQEDIEENAELVQEVFDGIDPPKLLGSELFEPLLPLSEDY